MKTIEEMLAKMNKHDCASMALEFVDHNRMNQDIQNWLFYYDADHGFVSVEDRQKCIDTACVWQIEWYLGEDEGFYSVCASSLELGLNHLLEQYEKQS